MNGIFRVGFFCRGEAAFARRRVINPRAQSRRGETQKRRFPRTPSVLQRGRRGGCNAGRLWLQRVPLRIELQPQCLEGTVAHG